MIRSIPYIHPLRDSFHVLLHCLAPWENKGHLLYQIGVSLASERISSF